MPQRNPEYETPAIEHRANPNRNLEHIAMLMRAIKEQSVYDEEGHRMKFNMAVWNCGTSACIGGHIELLKDKDGVPLAHWLGVDWRDADRLFFPWNYDKTLKWVTSATPDQAVTVLEHLFRTGQVDWSVAA